MAGAPLIAVLGAGSWGTTFSSVLAAAGCRVRIWARRADIAAEITERRTNRGYIPELTLPDTVNASSDAGAVLDGADGVVIAVPAQKLRGALEQWPALPDVPVVSLVKGIERDTDLRISELLASVGRIEPSRIAVLSGPNLAVEIAQQQPCAAVVASTSAATADRVARWCRAPYMRTYVSSDVIGVEVAGAMKNVIATAVGAAAGLGYGDNTRASLITRGLAEMTRLGTAVGARADTFAGLAGMGDLVATCASPLSRNFRLGAALGRGLSVEDAIREVGQTAEGVATARAVRQIAHERDLDLPITSMLVDVIDHGRDISSVTRELLSRSVRPE
ncbi:NAD(P)H-dependent glycerol-3-phosphate dehydrogenase [Helcobacillus massiliensis]|uniref:Glycerol-3-phosphate dehydrogenase [NAD(P)+] n=1 Tax=Helcobacillus massiliensis TaxID=521392 RepID=A0A839QTS3_9MICO|nr:NAD(P)H-dependent glycerol-3-phosphate dehydrogenase [Helcobacillus massiliensis]MBB3022170.1 glycerol-3-phosphate dehydrogenase (NAD(P)+) [Helcobacillus massiliensis]